MELSSPALKRRETSLTEPSFHTFRLKSLQNVFIRNPKFPRPTFYLQGFFFYFLKKKTYLSKIDGHGNIKVIIALTYRFKFVADKFLKFFLIFMTFTSILKNVVYSARTKSNLTPHLPV